MLRRTTCGCQDRWSRGGGGRVAAVDPGRDNGRVISEWNARALRDAGLQWRPQRGDRFVLPSLDLDGQVFTLSEMTIEAHHYETGTILGFNGTTEWALDSVAQEDALWLPSEEQLRCRLGATFVSLAAIEPRRYAVTTRTGAGMTTTYRADEAADAYAMALLDLISRALDGNAP